LSVLDWFCYINSVQFYNIFNGGFVYIPFNALLAALRILSFRGFR